MATYPPPPQSPAGSGSRRGPRANFGQRLVAVIIDGILVGIVGGILRLAVHSSLGFVVGHPSLHHGAGGHGSWAGAH